MMAGTPIFVLTCVASAGAGFLSAATRLSTVVVITPMALLLVGVDGPYVAGAVVVAALVYSVAAQVTDRGERGEDRRGSYLLGAMGAGAALLGTCASGQVAGFSAELWLPVMAIVLASLTCDVAGRMPVRSSGWRGVHLEVVGITACAAASAFLSCGCLQPILNAPIVLGIVAGTLMAARWKLTGWSVHDAFAVRYRLLLQGFFAVSCGCVIAGTVLWFTGQSGDAPLLTRFMPAPVEERLAAPIVSGALEGHAGAVIQLSVLCFLTLPIVSVLHGLLRAMTAQDQRSIVTAALVFAVLLGSLLSSAAGGL